MSVVFKGADLSAPISFIKMYSDGTPLVKTDQWANIVTKADTVVIQPYTLNEFFVGMFLVDAVNDARGPQGSPLRLILPYLPGARQDRSNTDGDVLFTAKSVANAINERKFYRVVSVDPHSPTMPALINNFDEFPLHRVYNKIPKRYTGVIAPDKGARGRATVAWNVIGPWGELRYGGKVRDVATGKLTGFQVEQLTPGGLYLVVDDICDGGGTFVGLGEKIREQGAQADLYVTHGIFSKGTFALEDMYENIITTDTREIHERANVEIIPIVEEMENY